MVFVGVLLVMPKSRQPDKNDSSSNMLVQFDAPSRSRIFPRISQVTSAFWVLFVVLLKTISLIVSTYRVIGRCSMFFKTEDAGSYSCSRRDSYVCSA